MSGDFHFAGTGTVTWRHGNRILAFGHPFLQSGPTEMPMASAEILTVVQSVSRSFKLSNTGPIIGTIYQDRLTAIAGEIGRQPNTTHFEVHLDAPGGKTRFFQGELFQNQMLSPTIAATSLLESLYSTMESEEKQTIYLDTTLEIPGHEPVKLTDAASGEEGPSELALRELAMYESLLNNPCEFPNVKSLTFQVRLADGWKSSRLDSLNLDRDEVKPGSMLHAVIGLRDYRGEPSAIPVSVPIPADLRASEVQLFVGDADAARQMDEPPPVPPQTLDQVLERLRLARSHQNLCVKLLETAPGVAVEGKNLPDLPPSVVAHLNSPTPSGGWRWAIQTARRPTAAGREDSFLPQPRPGRFPAASRKGSGATGPGAGAPVPGRAFAAAPAAVRPSAAPRPRHRRKAALPTRANPPESERKPGSPTARRDNRAGR